MRLSYSELGKDRFDFPLRLRYHSLMPKTQQKAKIITPEELKSIRYPLPESLNRAAGLLRHKKKALERHLQKVRKEWSRI